MEGGGFRVGVVCGMVADATDEAATPHDDVDMGRYEELDAAAEGVDVYLLVLADGQRALQPLVGVALRLSKGRVIVDGSSIFLDIERH